MHLCASWHVMFMTCSICQITKQPDGWAKIQWLENAFLSGKLSTGYPRLEHRQQKAMEHYSREPKTLAIHILFHQALSSSWLHLHHRWLQSSKTMNILYSRTSKYNETENTKYCFSNWQCAKFMSRCSVWIPQCLPKFQRYAPPSESWHTQLWKRSCTHSTMPGAHLPQYGRHGQGFCCTGASCQTSATHRA